RISVFVCTYTGSRTIRDCLKGLSRLAYPDYEVIVVDDGSRDATATIAQEYSCRLIRTANRGLANARNTGLKAATGEIVAYIDDDAYPDPHWLSYLAATFMSTAHAGVGGPNMAPPGDGPIAECVARAPGGPVHVLLNDHEAEHIPGCNMAFRKSCLEAIGGFDPQFRTAGDDVDVCWRLGQRAFPVAVRAGAERAGVSDPDARVASADRDAVGDGRTQPALRTPQARRAPRGRRPAPPHRAGDAKRHARVLSRGAPRDRAAQAHGGDGLPAPPAATRPARRPAPRGVDTLAPAGEAGAGAAVAPDGVGLERAVDTARPAVTGARNAPAVRRGRRAPRRGARLLGPRGTRRDSRRRPPARGGRGPRRGQAAPPASLVAPGSGARAGARAGVRRSCRRGRPRSPVGRRRPARPGRGPASAEHRRTMHGR